MEEGGIIFDEVGVSRRGGGFGRRFADAEIMFFDYERISLVFPCTGSAFIKLPLNDRLCPDPVLLEN